MLNLSIRHAYAWKYAWSAPLNLDLAGSHTFQDCYELRE
jgi:hypothetical protein